MEIDTINANDPLDDSEIADSTAEEENFEAESSTQMEWKETPEQIESPVSPEQMESEESTAQMETPRRKGERKSYICEECGYNAKNRKNRLTVHMLRHKKGDPEIPVFPCEVCGEKMTYIALRSHLRHMANPNRKYGLRHPKHASLSAAEHQKILDRLKLKYKNKQL